MILQLTYLLTLTAMVKKGQGNNTNAYFVVCKHITTYIQEANCSTFFLDQLPTALFCMKIV